MSKMCLNGWIVGQRTYKLVTLISDNLLGNGLSFVHSALSPFLLPVIAVVPLVVIKDNLFNGMAIVATILLSAW